MSNLAGYFSRSDQGASAATVNFSRPNPEKLTAFDVTAGAGSLTMNGLANTNLGTATFKVGAGSLTLSFDGALAQDATITIDGGASALTIYSGGNPVQGAGGFGGRGGGFGGGGCQGGAAARPGPYRATVNVGGKDIGSDTFQVLEDVWMNK